MDLGLLLLRLVVGGVLAAHGMQKLFGSFGGGGIKGTSGFFGQLGFRPASVFAAIAGLSEFGGGLLLVLGLLTPLGSAAVIAVMLVASLTVHKGKGLFGTNGGWELPLINATGAAAIAFTGPGRISVDHALGLGWYGVTWGVIAIALGVVGAMLALLPRAMAPKRAGAAST